MEETGKRKKKERKELIVCMRATVGSTAMPYESTVAAMQQHSVRTTQAMTTAYVHDLTQTCGLETSQAEPNAVFPRTGSWTYAILLLLFAVTGQSLYYASPPIISPHAPR